ncbi:MAG TPA: efflux RND transporter permease subunit [Tepidisphaeraceae bacterium]|jgi:CzcA family heavy metal efflux pump|nr:efflux RND transporter permease subunit [Tepidisphaeraceae bacterium]
MLRKLIAFSLNNAALVLVLAALLIAFAAFQVPRMPVDVFPELNAPTVVVLTEAKGLSADEVEQYVTFPIESAVNGLAGVRRVRSGSAMSLSLVYVEFDWGTDIDTARVRVGERLAIAEDELPEGVHTEIAPSTGITGEIMMIAVSSPDGSVGPMELRSFSEFELRQQLLSVAGIAQVVAIGGELPEYQVHVRQDSLRLYGLTMQDVVNAAGAAHSTASAGYLANVGGMELSITQSARVRSAQDIRDTIVKYHEGSAVTIGQVADVAMGPTPARGTASAAGEPAVVLSIKKSPGTNTLDITRAIDATLDQVDKGLAAGMKIDRHVLRQSDFIRLSVSNVVHVLRDAAIFVAVVLILFLLNVRTTIITLTAIPLSLAMAVLAMRGLGLSINVMTLGGLAIAIGELVDDAIIDVENIYRRLCENRLLPEPQRKPDLRVIFDASNEVRSSVVFATVIIVIVFVPLLFLQGVEGRFFQPMGVAYITSILASLLVALTVVPAMCRYLLRGKLGGEHKDGFVVRWLKSVYEPALRLALRWRLAVIALAAVATGASLWLASTFGSNFLPDFNEGTLTIFIDAPPETSLTESDRMVRGLDRQLAQVEGVRSVVRRTGRAERDEHAHGVNRSEIQVSINEGVDKSTVLHRIDDVLANVPGLKTEVGAPIGHQLSHVLSGTQAAIAINIYGNELATLRQIAEDVEGAITPIPGVRDVLANREAAIESLSVRYRHQDLKRWGLTPASAAEQVEAAFSGIEVDRVNEGVRQRAIVVRLHPDERESVQSVKRLLLRGEGGALVRLSEVADVGPERTPLGIQRENARRKAVVSLNVAEGYNLGHIVEAVQAKVDPLVHSYGYTVTYGGQFEAQQSAARTIYVMGAFVCLVILLLLSLALGSNRAALLVMVNLPLALIGGVVAIFLSESPSLVDNLLGLFGAGTYRAPVISIASMVGFVTLFGIAVRNGILLVNHYAHLLREEGAAFDEAVVRGSLERLVPILMTALTAVLGLVPLAMAKGEPGSELLAPLAIVVLGGLVTSTLLNLIVVPAGYHLMFHKRPIALTTQRAERVDADAIPVA